MKQKLQVMKAVEVENKKLNAIMQETTKEFDKIKEILQQERDEKMDLLQVS